LSAWILPVSTTSTGQAAEALVAKALAARGLVLVERNYRTRWSEIDLIMRRDHTLHFIEVKYRGGQGAGRPEEFIGPRKRLRLAQAAAAYTARTGWTGPYQIDAASVTPSGIGYIADITGLT
jgi:putative endonuclease